MLVGETPISLRRQSHFFKGSLKAEMPKIFICYRRQDSDYPAQYICSKLRQHFGADSIVFDVDSVPLGVDFRKYLNDQVSQCAVLLAIIGDKWLTLLNEHPAEAPDYVRIELEAALEHDVPVVPVLVREAKMPEAASLPKEISDLAYRNGAEVRGGADLSLHLTSLVLRLERLFAGQAKRKAISARIYQSVDGAFEFAYSSIRRLKVPIAYTIVVIILGILFYVVTFDKYQATETSDEPNADPCTLPWKQRPLDCPYP